MRNLLSSCLLYALLISFIMGWWSLAFRAPSSAAPLLSSITSQPLALKTSSLLEELSPLQRETLHQALSGNFSLMLDLIDQWDQDAQLLAQNGLPHIQRLSTESYLQAHILGHLLQDSSSIDLRQLNCKMNLEGLYDDRGRYITIQDHFQRFLPQTYVAASFLLAIAQPHEIVALPRGLRHLPQIYSADRLKQIPLNIEGLSSEKLYQAQPDLAFVAPYSHPPALEALRNQGIPLYTLQHVNTVAEIQEALLKIGHASNHILEAQLLSLFMEACFLSIDNRLSALQTLTPASAIPLKMLYLYYNQSYMLPTTKCLTGQLMSRALQHCPHLLCSLPESEYEWRIPCEQEKIVQANPDCLIITTPYQMNSRLLAERQPALQNMTAFQSQRIAYLDETIQESPSQYIVLAYYDILHALTAIHQL